MILKLQAQLFSYAFNSEDTETRQETRVKYMMMEVQLEIRKWWLVLKWDPSEAVTYAAGPENPQ